MMTLPVWSKVMTILPYAVWSGQQIFGPFDAVLVESPNACLSALTASRMAIMKAMTSTSSRVKLAVHAIVVTPQ